MPDGSLTIGRLARAADVGIETVRYYQQRKLLPVPAAHGAFRHYNADAVNRIRFIKRAQELGFSLAEIGELLKLQDGVDRRAIRRISSERLAQIETKLTDLKRMQRVLKQLVAECEVAGTNHPCPIIEALTARRRNDYPSPGYAPARPGALRSALKSWAVEGPSEDISRRPQSPPPATR